MIINVITEIEYKDIRTKIENQINQELCQKQEALFKQAKEKGLIK
jgi:hypothetical protein